MISLIMLIFILLVIGIGTITLVRSSGIVVLLVFGDVIVCAFMVYMIIKSVLKKK